LKQGETFICPIRISTRSFIAIGRQRSAVHSFLCRMPADNPRWGAVGTLSILDTQPRILR
jgi:hypothetical protein